MSTKTKDECEQEDMELPLFDLDKIVNATIAFSTDNKLGEGGFGPVYREPGFLIKNSSIEGHSYGNEISSSTNEITMTLLDAR
ncbi:G-type lectin S-receptor-like serine/threonine-protein kinase [Senna tora]|uniref:G-type lectin S-receptor-like serine/threonine-protein kinase n=1 Tax=Senna tora TaxID=362788 RepID=A0A834WMZ1_9FABA|nr:G-type lectin S-receptor-like serine/threonine-protein kinase [Senna tora]